MIRLALILLALACLPGTVRAHALEPGFLEMEALGGDEWRVTWRRPQVAGAPMPIEAVLPETCETQRGGTPAFDGRAFVSGWVARCPGGIGGGTVVIEGLENTRTDVLVRYTLEPGEAAQTRRLMPGEPAFAVPPPQGRLAVARSYFRLGVDHILTGLDHLLFVLVLLLVIRRLRPMVEAVTAFTVAHSLSLAAASLGWIVVPAPPVEAVVALSILILATELAQPEGQGLRLTERFPWSVAFCFGLLHGLGFARALLEIGLPQGDIPLALLSFNVGVEAGQLAFIGVLVAAAATLARVVPGLRAQLLSPASPTLRVAAYGVGTLAAYWTISRVAAFVV